MDMRRIADRLVRAVADVAAFFWFRSVEVSAIERMPSLGPVVVVANHGGGFVDPALLTSVLPRSPRYLAMASLWRYVVTRPFLALAGAIPVRRAQDGTTGGNVDAFDECHQVLIQGGVIAIFPEGEASDSPHLLPVKTGAARIALGARAAGAAGISILPVGLMYEDKTAARSRAYVRIGTPLDLDAAVRAALPTPTIDDRDRDAVEVLTEEIAARLSRAALDFSDAAELSSLENAAEIALRAAGDHAPRLGAIQDLAGRLASVPGVADVVDAEGAYREALEAHAVTDRAVGVTPAHGFRRIHVVATVATLLLVPFALVGAIVNAAPAGLVHLAGRPRMAPVTRATSKFLTAIVLFPLSWVAWRYLAFDGLAHPWWWTAAAGPACGLATLWVADRVRRAWRARLDLRRLAATGPALEELLRRRGALIEAIDRAAGRVRPM
jgi:glycerol-3-phosphate O-acyltransferase/dihydroxyacetone phosphate acyltransferase